MRKIAATYIFPGNGKPLKYGILVCENDGTVIETIDSLGRLNEQSGLEFYNGILVPGFMNARCYFELSHPKELVSEKTEIEKFKSYPSGENTFFVLCPHSNLFIENKLPPLDFFRRENITVCLGSNSQTLNSQFSIFAEMLILQQNFPELTLEELIKWACFNGARALKTDDCAGSFEKGKKPGVNLISGIDFKNMKLTGNSRVKQLI